MNTRTETPSLLTFTLLGALVAASTAAASCSSSGGSSTTTGAGGQGGQGSTSSSTGTGGDDITFPDGGGSHADFPAAPVVDPALGADVPGLFQGAAGEPTGGPCLAEPALGAMVPRNWTPLFFEWTAGPGQNVFELRFEVDNQTNPLLVYTTATSFTFDAAIWKALTDHSSGHDIQVTVRGATLEGGALTAGPATGASGVIHLSPAAAAGSVVYWAATGGTSFKGFTIGDTTSKVVLTPVTAGATSTGGTTTCISCHASTPDGKYLIYSRDADDNTRSIDARKVTGGPPDPADISAAALALLGRHKQSAPVTTKAHYSPSDAVVVTVGSDPALNGGRYELLWTDLHAADANGWGVIARDGDPRNASSPSWRQDGSAIAYVSTAGGGEGVIAAPTVADSTFDIYTVPYNTRAGGAATPLAGASDPSYNEFYPVYSPGDTLVAFNRTDLSPPSSYNQPAAEVFIVPSGGGAATRLSANDPPACTGFTSPGLTNSWARWAPSAETVAGRRYYWLVFSSKRRAAANDEQGNLRPQLYVSAVVTKVEGGKETFEAEYPALYITAQSPDDNNHTPAWDEFVVQQIPQ